MSSYLAKPNVVTIALELRVDVPLLREQILELIRISNTMKTHGEHNRAALVDGALSALEAVLDSAVDRPRTTNTGEP